MSDYFGKVIFAEKELSTAEAKAVTCRYGMTLTLYRHYGIGINDGRVIHFRGGFFDCSGEARIIETSEREFSKGSQIKMCYRTSYEYSPDEVVFRAISKLHTDFGGYHLFNNNCEHFANWCANGKKTSSQVFFKNDDKVIVEKVIDRIFEPGIIVNEKIDDVFAGVGSFIRSFFI